MRILKDLDESIEGRDVLLVEDIVDTGMTLNHLLTYLRARKPGDSEGLHAARQAGAAPGRSAAGLRGL